MLAFSQFVSGTRLIAHHHVVVLDEKRDSVLILPTVSIEAHIGNARIPGEIGPKDRASAGWKNRCRFRPDALQWVPRSWIVARPGVRLSNETMNTLTEVASKYGPHAQRYTEADANALEFVSARKDKKRIAA
jgi:hypothetical protein